MGKFITYCSIDVLRLFYFFDVYRVVRPIKANKLLEVKMANNNEETREFIRKNYAAVALKGAEGGCCGGGCSITFDFSPSS